MTNLAEQKKQQKKSEKLNFRFGKAEIAWAKNSAKIRNIIFWFVESRNWPRDHDFRNLRQKLLGAPKFSSKSVAWRPVSWPSKDFNTKHGIFESKTIYNIFEMKNIYHFSE